MRVFPATEPVRIQPQHISARLMTMRSARLPTSVRERLRVAGTRIQSPTRSRAAPARHFPYVR